MHRLSYDLSVVIINQSFFNATYSSGQLCINNRICYYLNVSWPWLIFNSCLNFEDVVIHFTSYLIEFIQDVPLQLHYRLRFEL